MIRVDVYLDDPAGLLAAGAFDAGALIRIESTNDLDDAFAEVGTIAIDTTTVQPFTFWDAAGTADTWYRWLVSDATNATRSPASDPRHGISPTSTATGGTYADLGDFLAIFSTRPLPKLWPRLTSLLRVATDELINEMGGRDYFRHPVTGTEDFDVDADGCDVLHVHQGIVSLDSVALTFDLGRTHVALEDANWVLRGDSPRSAEGPRDGEPAFHLLLVDVGPYRSFPKGRTTVRLTGALGWPAIPSPLREGTVERARQLAYADPAFAGQVPGPSEYGGGQPVYERWPQVTWRFLEAERHRFWCDL